MSCSYLSGLIFSTETYWSQDENAKATAVRTIQDSSDKMKKKKVEVEEYESSLDKEEKILEGIRDSLKGKIISVSSSQNHAATDIYVCV